MASLFEAAGMEAEAPRPLADRLRPEHLGEVVGQDHLLGEEGALTRMLDAGRLGSIILWGPPGTGKTTIARLLAGKVDLEFVQLSAIFSGVADLRKAFEAAKQRRMAGQGTLLFVDEIHRFNRAQQDGFLPHVEDGTIVLVGATTENPSFELNPAVLSRAQVLTLKRLDEPALEQLLQRAEAHMGRALPVIDEAREALFALADGDGRYALNLAEELFAAVSEDAEPLDREGLSKIVQRRVPLYDKGQDGHYNLISA
ncbi:MAG: AAA family ATPase, partial [Rhizobiales bacterium]|nr:AAA family ATPase [Hyphomicrobiales bacterium]